MNDFATFLGANSSGVAPAMILFRTCVSILALTLVSACASYDAAPPRQSAIGCDEAVTQSTAFGRGQATAIAVNSLRHQVSDVRGYLLSQGFRHVRPAGRSVTCRLHPFGAGLVQCTAVARFCGG
ncbi:MAG: hypothetical protein ABL897_03690 [Hyphomicrobium sp.]